MFALLLTAAACSSSVDPGPEPPAAGGGGGVAGVGGAGAAGEASAVNACAGYQGGGAQCQGVCTSLQIDRLHCGSCGNACPSDMSCVGGRCSCAEGANACGNACVDLRWDQANCGSCGRACKSGEACQEGACTAQQAGECGGACSGGRICQDGGCVCAGGRKYCANSCVDTRSNNAHCGACNAACGDSQSCQDSHCQCTNGKTACGTSCVDLQSDAAFCGTCDRACTGSERCSAGSCKKIWNDNCTDVAARGITLRELAVYQGVKVSIMRDGMSIDPPARTADVIRNRNATLRVFLDTIAPFKVRAIAARLTLVNDDGVDYYSVKQKVSQSSSDADAASTFQLNVPGAKIQANSRYTLELVECAADSGGAAKSPRFPVNGSAGLITRKTGVLKVTIIPVKANSRVPDTSDAGLKPYREYLEAMYPIERLELSVGKQISTKYPINWTSLVEQIRAQRKADAPAGDVYYFGMVQPTETLRDFCGRGCTAGIGYVNPANQPATRAAVGVAYGDEISASTMAHEIGHNHGRNHAPCAPSDSISGLDDDYPYDKALLGAWGYDARTKAFLSPELTRDLMGYCDPKWISDYTFRALTERVAFINSPEGLMPSDTTPLASYRVLLVDAEGPRWSTPITDPIAAFGVPEQAEVYDVYNQPIAQLTVYRTRLSEGEAATILVPEPEPTWMTLVVQGAAPIAFDAPISE